MTERQIIERLKELRSKSGHIEELTEESQQKHIDLKKRWMTYYRNNPEIYIEKRMKFHSFGYQNISYHLMGVSNQYAEVSTRGTGKSLRCTVMGAALCLLYPNLRVGITSQGQSQANEDFQTAFMQELVYKYSPFMNHLYKKGLITTRESEKGYVVRFWNGSTMTFFACIDSSRGNNNIIIRYHIIKFL